MTSADFCIAIDLYLYRSSLKKKETAIQTSQGKLINFHSPTTMFTAITFDSYRLRLMRQTRLVITALYIVRVP